MAKVCQRLAKRGFNEALDGKKGARVPATKDRAQRVAHEYERNGTASIIQFVEPLAHVASGNGPGVSDEE